MKIVTIREATVQDIGAINQIYNYYVINSTCTYQTEPETYEMRLAWFKQHSASYPVLIAEKDGKIAGWAALSPYNRKPAYKPTVENSIYIHHDCKGRGIGTLLLSELITRAKQLGYHSIIAIISGEQEVSIALHKKLGYTKVAELKEVGFKSGCWLNVVFYQLLL